MELIEAQLTDGVRVHAPGGARGRILVTARPFKAGELVLRQAPVGVALRSRFQERWCAHCLRFACSALPRACVGCGLCWYCSARCQAAHAEGGHALECRTLRSLNPRELPREVAFAARWLSSTLAHPEHRAVAALLQDGPELPGFQKRRKCFQGAVKAFLEASKRAAWTVDASEPELLRLLAGTPRNDFGLYGPDGELEGQGNFPALAMANHSCVPTAALRQEGRFMCLYALQPLPKGAEVTHCYVSLDEAGGGEDPAALREVLHTSWGFRCGCARCTGAEACRVAAFDARHRCECGGVVLAAEGELGCACNTWNRLPDPADGEGEPGEPPPSGAAGGRRVLTGDPPPSGAAAPPPWGEGPEDEGTRTVAAAPDRSCRPAATSGWVDEGAGGGTRE